MPLPTKWNKQKRRPPPPGFDYVEPVLEALEHELRDVVKDTNLNRRKLESLWPVHQINWQKSRYIYDLYYKHHQISKQVYQYCLDQKLVDAELIAKWKKPGYERLCSTYVINPANYKFGTVSICRVPWKDRNADQKDARDPTTGCLGCSSGPGQPRNIFGNKYGQSLAAVQLARERRRQEQLAKQEEAKAKAAVALQLQQQQQIDGDGEEETDDEEDDDDGDYGPSPAAGIWAGGQQLQRESEKLDDGGDDDDGEAETEDEAEEDDHERPSKKPREGES